MKKIYLLLLMLGSLILIGAVAIFIVTRRPQQPVTGPSTSFPQAGTGTAAGGTTAAITLTDGTTAVIPDFSKTKQPLYGDPENGYGVSGSGEGADYLITYFPNQTGFLITLLKEPLGDSRREAEAALRKELGLTNDQLCKLPNTQVNTVGWVNEQYAGKSLGLSFCPDATQLPF